MTSGSSVFCSLTNPGGLHRNKFIAISNICFCKFWSIIKVYQLNIRLWTVINISFQLLMMMKIVSDHFKVFLHISVTYLRHTGPVSVCSTSSCLDASSNIVGAMNYSVSPCSDMWTYSCGGWTSKHSIPESRYLNNEHKIHFSSTRCWKYVFVCLEVNGA